MRDCLFSLDWVDKKIVYREVGAASDARLHFLVHVVRADHSAQCLRILTRRVFHTLLRRASATTTLYCCRHELQRLAISARSQSETRALPLKTHCCSPAPTMKRKVSYGLQQILWTRIDICIMM